VRVVSLAVARSDSGREVVVSGFVVPLLLRGLSPARLRNPIIFEICKYGRYVGSWGSGSSGR
jgi:hypothetical protein